jgi:hypothetical protein
VHNDDRRLPVNHGERASDRIGTFGASDDECIGGAGRKQLFSGCFLTGGKHHHDVIGGGATGGERTIDDPFTTEHFVLLQVGSVAPARAGREHDRPDRTVRGKRIYVGHGFTSGRPPRARMMSRG